MSRDVLRKATAEDKTMQMLITDVQKGVCRKALTRLRTPWDQEPYNVVGIKGSKVTAQKGEQMRERAKNNIKVVKHRPAQLKVKSQRKVRVEADHDLEVDMDKIRVLSHPLQVHQEQAREEEEPGGEQGQGGVHDDTPGEEDTSEDGNEDDVT